MHASFINFIDNFVVLHRLWDFCTARWGVPLLVITLQRTLFCIVLITLIFVCRTVETTLWSCPVLTGSVSVWTSVSLCRCLSDSASTASSTTSTWWTISSLYWPVSLTHRSVPSGTPAPWQVCDSGSVCVWDQVNRWCLCESVRLGLKLLYKILQWSWIFCLFKRGVIDTCMYAIQ